MDDSNLIFIVSQPRAGSTYLQNLLSNNSFSNTVSEPWILLAFAPLIKPELVQSATYDHRAAMDALLDYHQKNDHKGFKEQVKSLVYQHYELIANGYQYVIDKTPRYWEVFDELIDLFPSAKIIVLKRNPVDVLRSMITTWDIKTMRHLDYMRRDIMIAPLRLNEKLKEHAGNSNIYSLYYEDLVSNDQTIKELYAWIGLDFDKDYQHEEKNTKFKGKFGDIYQNADGKKTKHPINALMQDFINGYINRLDEELVEEFKIERSTTKQTLAYRYFAHLGLRNASQNKQSLKAFLKMLILEKLLKSKFNHI